MQRSFTPPMPPSDQDIRNRLLVVRLPALPHILLKLMEYCRTEQTGIPELAELIVKDPAIAAKIMEVANSSAFHRGRPKTRLDQSLMSIGTDIIRTLVISEAIHQAFNGFSITNSVNLCNFWEHSLTVGVLARDIARKIGYANIDEAYLAGLLHDVGRLAFLAISPKEYAQCFLKKDDETLCSQEEQSLRMTHSEAGAWLAERWKFDPHIADSVLYHHEPLSRIASAHPLVQLIYLAHILAEQRYDAPEAQAAAELCNVPFQELAAIQQESAKKVRDAAEFLGIELGADRGAGLSSQESHSAVQQKLNDELHHVVRASETERNFARQTNEPALIKTASKSAHILFQIEDATVLEWDAASQILSPHPEADAPPGLQAFSLPSHAGGAIADTIKNKRLGFIIRSDRPSLEDPLLRALGADVLVCLPLVAGTQCLGLLIGKIAPAKVAALRAQAGFAQVFATQVTAALLALRQKQDALRHAATSAIDEFKLNSRKVAHEVNNPLAVIKNYLRVLNDKLHKQEPLGAELSILNEEIDRVGRIVQQFADPQPVRHQKTTDVNRILHDTARLLKDSGFAPATITFATEFDEQAGEIECNEDTLRQILLNLLKNAIEAMPKGGEITLANLGHVNQNGRLYIELAIKDTGGGVPKSILGRLFSPVSSTKGDGHQGLGLSIVQDLVKDLNGFITCRTGSRGTAFELLLPVRPSDDQDSAS